MWHHPDSVVGIPSNRVSPKRVREEEVVVGGGCKQEEGEDSQEHSGGYRDEMCMVKKRRGQK